MSDTDLSHYVPRRLDATSKFLFWDFDVAGIAIVCVMLGVGAGYSLMGLVVGIGGAWAYSQLKSGEHPGVAAHTLYWWVGIPSPRELPPSNLREFNG